MRREQGQDTPSKAARSIEFDQQHGISINAVNASPLPAQGLASPGAVDMRVKKGIFKSDHAHKSHRPGRTRAASERAIRSILDNPERLRGFSRDVEKHHTVSPR